MDISMDTKDVKDKEKEKEKGTKRAHRRTFQALLMGSKIRHLKKKDGEPLWRADIQYDFLHAIFFDQHRVFTNPYTRGDRQSFADIYIDAMARSSKCSRILSDKLTGDRGAALSVAMVCLLVNIGRMNTTLNFFPEMKAQLRTYHPIPSLQSHDTADYKQLQDAPRLKSILKGAAEDRDEPTTFEQMREPERGRPPTNAINLVFLMSAYAGDVAKLMANGTSFFDLIMDHTSSSKSRGRMFLWLVWAYLESDLSDEQLAANPFGDGMSRPPPLVPLTEEEQRQENVDPPSEVTFGNQMTLQRLSYLEGEDHPNGPTGGNWGTVTPTPPSAVPAPAVVPRARTAHTRRVHDEFYRLLAEKRRRRRRSRRLRETPAADLWRATSIQDPVYSSDTEPVLATGDYGESTMAAAATLRRALRHYKTTDAS